MDIRLDAVVDCSQQETAQLLSSRAAQAVASPDFTESMDACFAHSSDVE